MKKRLIAVMIVVAMCFVVLAACADDPVEEVVADGERVFHFGYTSMTQFNPFFVILEQSMREVIEDAGHTMTTMNPAMDQETQINQIEDLIAMGIDLMFVNPVDSGGITPALVMLQDAGIPIINFDTDVDDIEFVVSFIGSDNFNAGYVVGLDMMERLPDGGPIAVIDAPAFQSVRDRIDGFMAAIEGHGFEIVFQQDGRGDLETAIGVADDLLVAHPEVLAIFAGNDPSALGTLAAVLAAGRTDVLVYGVDGSPDAKAAMAEGGPFMGSGAQSPISIGRWSAEAALRLLAGETIEAHIPVPTFMINQENVHEFGIDDWQ